MVLPTASHTLLLVWRSPRDSPSCSSFSSRFFSSYTFFFFIRKEKKGDSIRQTARPHPSSGSSTVKERKRKKKSNMFEEINKTKKRKRVLDILYSESLIKDTQKAKGNISSPEPFVCLILKVEITYSKPKVLFLFFVFLSLKNVWSRFPKEKSTTKKAKTKHLFKRLTLFLFKSLPILIHIFTRFFYSNFTRFIQFLLKKQQKKNNMFSLFFFFS